MQTRTLPAIGFLILGILVLAGCAQAPIALRDMGSFHVGGRDVEISGRPVKEVVFTPGGVPAKVDPNGTYSVEAMYVQYFLPAERRGVVPLLLWHGGGLTGVTYGTTTDDAILRAYIAEIDKVCPCAILFHSQAGQFGFRAAQARPEKVKALIAVEPAGIGDPRQAAALKGIPVLMLYGDFIAQDARWPQIRKNGIDFTEGIARAGGKVEVVDLPNVGIRGNSHMLMMDRNNLEIAALIQRWLEGQGLYR